MEPHIFTEFDQNQTAELRSMVSLVMNMSRGESFLKIYIH